MTEEARISLSESECARIMASVNWLMGFVQGRGYEIPDEMVNRFAPLAKHAGLEHMTGQIRS